MRKEIEALYGANDPEKLPQVDALLAKYGDRKLLAMVRKKYAVTPPRKEIEALYAANNPEKLAEVDSLKRSASGKTTSGINSLDDLFHEQTAVDR